MSRVPTRTLSLQWPAGNACEIVSCAWTLRDALCPKTAFVEFLPGSPARLLHLGSTTSSTIKQRLFQIVLAGILQPLGRDSWGISELANAHHAACSKDSGGITPASLKKLFDLHGEGAIVSLDSD